MVPSVCHCMRHEAVLSIFSNQLHHLYHCQKWIYTPKKETPRLFICKFLNDQMEYREGLCLIFIPIELFNRFPNENFLPHADMEEAADAH